MTETTTEHSEPNQPLGLALTDLLGRAPWADDVEAWLEASSAEEIADDIDRYTMAEVARAVAVERERCARIVERINGWVGTREVAAEIRGETQILKA